jgi:hypothetical protein
MEQIPGMNDTAIILLCILMLVGGAAIYAMICVLLGRGPRHAEESPVMRVGLTLTLMIAAWVIFMPLRAPDTITIERDRPLAAVIDKHCPPADRDAPAIITMLITTQADERPAVTHCQRYRNPYDKPSPARQALRLTEAK